MYNVKNNAQNVASMSVKATTIDKKLVAILKLYERAKTNIFGRFDAFSFTTLLKILIKIAIMRPIALVNLPLDNRTLVSIIH